MEKGTIKNIILSGIIIVALFIAYNVFIKGGSPDEGVLVSISGGRSVAETPQAASELLRILGDLKKIKLDTSILSDEAYRSLEDWSVRLVPEPQGRKNPFAPLE